MNNVTISAAEFIELVRKIQKLETALAKISTFDWPICKIKQEAQEALVTDKDSLTVDHVPDARKKV
jgi:hypothetical protein